MRNLFHLFLVTTTILVTTILNTCVAISTTATVTNDASSSQTNIIHNNNNNNNNNKRQKQRKLNTITNTRKCVYLRTLQTDRFVSCLYNRSNNPSTQQLQQQLQRRRNGPNPRCVRLLKNGLDRIQDRFPLLYTEQQQEQQQQEVVEGGGCAKELNTDNLYQLFKICTKDEMEKEECMELVRFYVGLKVLVVDDLTTTPPPPPPPEEIEEEEEEVNMQSSLSDLPEMDSMTTPSSLSQCREDKFYTTRCMDGMYACCNKCPPCSNHHHPEEEEEEDVVTIATAPPPLPPPTTTTNTKWDRIFHTSFVVSSSTSPSNNNNLLSSAIEYGHHVSLGGGGQIGTSDTTTTTNDTTSILPFRLAISPKYNALSTTATIDITTTTSSLPQSLSSLLIQPPQESSSSSPPPPPVVTLFQEESNSVWINMDAPIYNTPSSSSFSVSSLPVGTDNIGNIALLSKDATFLLVRSIHGIYFMDGSSSSTLNNNNGGGGGGGDGDDNNQAMMMMMDVGTVQGYVYHDDLNSWELVFNYKGKDDNDEEEEGMMMTMMESIGVVALAKGDDGNDDNNNKNRVFIAEFQDLSEMIIGSLHHPPDDHDGPNIGGWPDEQYPGGYDPHTGGYDGQYPGGGGYDPNDFHIGGWPDENYPEGYDPNTSGYDGQYPGGGYDPNGLNTGGEPGRPYPEGYDPNTGGYDGQYPGGGYDPTGSNTGVGPDQPYPDGYYPGGGYDPDTSYLDGYYPGGGYNYPNTGRTEGQYSGGNNDPKVDGSDSGRHRVQNKVYNEDYNAANNEGFNKPSDEQVSQSPEPEGVGRNLQFEYPGQQTVMSKFRVLSIDGDGNIAQVGGDILEVIQEYGHSGSKASVEISGDGKTVAIGFRMNGDKCYSVVLFQLSEESVWGQAGQRIQFDDDHCMEAYTLALHCHGQYVAIGSVQNGGLVRIYEFAEGRSIWIQRGNSLRGDIMTSFGKSLSMDEKGDHIVVGAPDHNGPDRDRRLAGQVNVYKYNFERNYWQNDGVIYGEMKGQRFGFSVSMDLTGTRIAVGSPGDGGRADIYQMA